VLRINLAGILAEKDDYLDVFIQDMVYSDQPIKKLFLTDSQGVVHCFVQSQLEDENEIFDGLVNICQVFGNILLDGLVLKAT